MLDGSTERVITSLTVLILSVLFILKIVVGENVAGRLRIALYVLYYRFENDRTPEHVVMVNRQHGNPSGMNKQQLANNRFMNSRRHCLNKKGV